MTLAIGPRSAVRINNQAAINAGTAHSNNATRSGTRRASIHTATPSINTPNMFLTVSIQAPARGNKRPAEAPTTNNGAPMPSAMTNNAAPPRHMFPVWLMTISVAISGGATQAVTMSADNAPMTATPAKLPVRCRLLTSLRRV